MKLRLAIALFGLAFARPVFGQSNPGDVVRSFFKAEDESRWIDAARMLDLKSFEPIQRNAIATSRQRGTFRQLSAEEVMKLDPGMPRTVAEYQVKRSNELRARDYILDEFARVPSVDSLAALSTEQAAARWLEAQGPEWRTELASRDNRGYPKIDCPGLSDSAKKALIVQSERMPQVRVLGETQGSDSLRYVVIAEDYGMTQVRSTDRVSLSPHVITLVNVGNAWKIVPAFDMPRANGVGGMTTYAISCSRDSLQGKGQKK